MAARILLSRKHIIAYLPNLNAIVRHFSAFNVADRIALPAAGVKSLDIAATGCSSQKYDKACSFESTKPDWRFPLPGNIGIASSLPLCDADKLDLEFTAPNHAEELVDQISTKSKSVNSLEYVAQELPQSVRKDFADLFPDRRVNEESLTVVTLTQRTQNDMTSWSEQVDVEREQLLASFISGASDICEALKQSGFWADFIDPASGRPYFGVFTNSTLFETDERYRKLGFEIEDAGCCKVISHHLWGSYAYVGSIFTNAPMDHGAISNVTLGK